MNKGLSTQENNNRRKIAMEPTSWGNFTESINEIKNECLERMLKLERENALLHKRYKHLEDMILPLMRSHHEENSFGQLLQILAHFHKPSMETQSPLPCHSSSSIEELTSLLICTNIAQKDILKNCHYLHERVSHLESLNAKLCSLISRPDLLSSPPKSTIPVNAPSSSVSLNHPNRSLPNKSSNATRSPGCHLNSSANSVVECSCGESFYSNAQSTHLHEDITRPAYAVTALDCTRRIPLLDSVLRKGIQSLNSIDRDSDLEGASVLSVLNRRQSLAEPLLNSTKNDSASSNKSTSNVNTAKQSNICHKKVCNNPNLNQILMCVNDFRNLSRSSSVPFLKRALGSSTCSAMNLDKYSRSQHDHHELIRLMSDPTLTHLQPSQDLETIKCMLEDEQMKEQRRNSTPEDCLRSNLAKINSSFNKQSSYRISKPLPKGWIQLTSLPQTGPKRQPISTHSHVILGARSLPIVQNKCSETLETSAISVEASPSGKSIEIPKSPRAFASSMRQDSSLKTIQEIESEAHILYDPNSTIPLNSLPDCSKPLTKGLQVSDYHSDSTCPQSLTLPTQRDILCRDQKLRYLYPMRSSILQTSTPGPDTQKCSNRSNDLETHLKLQDAFRKYRSAHKNLRYGVFSDTELLTGKFTITSTDDSAIDSGDDDFHSSNDSLGPKLLEETPDECNQNAGISNGKTNIADLQTNDPNFIVSPSQRPLSRSSITCLLNSSRPSSHSMGSINSNPDPSLLDRLPSILTGSNKTSSTSSSSSSSPHCIGKQIQVGLTLESVSSNIETGQQNEDEQLPRKTITEQDKETLDSDSSGSRTVAPPPVIIQRRRFGNPGSAESISSTRKSHSYNVKEVEHPVLNTEEISPMALSDEANEFIAEGVDESFLVTQISDVQALDTTFNQEIDPCLQTGLLSTKETDLNQKATCPSQKFISKHITNFRSTKQSLVDRSAEDKSSTEPPDTSKSGSSKFDLKNIKLSKTPKDNSIGPYLQTKRGVSSLDKNQIARASSAVNSPEARRITHPQNHAINLLNNPRNSATSSVYSAVSRSSPSSPVSPNTVRKSKPTLTASTALPPKQSSSPSVTKISRHSGIAELSSLQPLRKTSRFSARPKVNSAEMQRRQSSSSTAENLKPTIGPPPIPPRTTSRSHAIQSKMVIMQSSTTSTLSATSSRRPDESPGQSDISPHSLYRNSHNACYAKHKVADPHYSIPSHIKPDARSGDSQNSHSFLESSNYPAPSSPLLRILNCEMLSSPHWQNLSQSTVAAVVAARTGNYSSENIKRPAAYGSPPNNPITSARIRSSVATNDLRGPTPKSPGSPNTSTSRLAQGKFQHFKSNVASPMRIGSPSSPNRSPYLRSPELSHPSMANSQNSKLLYSTSQIGYREVPGRSPDMKLRNDDLVHSYVQNRMNLDKPYSTESGQLFSNFHTPYLPNPSLMMHYSNDSHDSTTALY